MAAFSANLIRILSIRLDVNFEAKAIVPGNRLFIIQRIDFTGFYEIKTMKCPRQRAGGAAVAANPPFTIRQIRHGFRRFDPDIRHAGHARAGWLIHSLKARCEFLKSTKRSAKRAKCECVELRLSRTRTGELLGAIATGCERLVHPSVTDAALRLCHRRFIGIMLAAPFVVAGVVAILFPPHLGAGMTLAAICVTFGAAWLAALLVAATGRMWAADVIALMLGSTVLAAIVAAAGGLASPTVLAIAALPFEAWWLRRTPKAALAGAAAALAVIPVAGHFRNGLPCRCYRCERRTLAHTASLPGICRPARCRMGRRGDIRGGSGPRQRIG